MKRRAAAACAVVALCACAGSAKLPPVATHAGETPVLVPYPPPPQKVEILPPRPAAAGAVWIDGEWQFVSGRWEWRQGRWEVPPEGATYAPPVIDYLSGEQIAWYPSRWRRKSPSK